MYRVAPRHFKLVALASSSSWLFMVISALMLSQAVGLDVRLFCTDFHMPLLCLRVCWLGLGSSPLLPPIRLMFPVNHMLHLGLPPVEMDV